MTRVQRLGNLWHRVAGFVGIFLVAVSLVAIGAAGMYWMDKGERMQLVERFPIVRAEERAACTREFTAKLEGMERLSKQGARAQADIEAQMRTTNELAAYTLRFLGDRARITDARAAVMLEQTRAAAVAANTAAQKSAQIAQKADVAAVKADEAASTAKAIDRRLDTAVHPPLPAKPWAGSYR